eukprot:7477135-Lingulodinium_polyedra.AAC.1
MQHFDGPDNLEKFTAAGEGWSEVATRLPFFVEHQESQVNPTTGVLALTGSVVRGKAALNLQFERLQHLVKDSENSSKGVALF